jgi:hypothetical protein
MGLPVQAREMKMGKSSFNWSDKIIHVKINISGIAYFQICFMIKVYQEL